MHVLDQPLQANVLLCVLAASAPLLFSQSLWKFGGSGAVSA